MKQKIEKQIGVLNKILLELQSIEETINKKDIEISLKIKDREINFTSEEIQNSGLKELNIKEIKNKIYMLLRKYENINKNFEKEFGKYNEQYVKNLIEESTNFNNSYIEYINGNNIGFLNKEGIITYKVNFFKKINEIVNPNLNNLYEYFKYGNKNYVIFGKNGAGKTTLLHQIKKNILNKNSFVIPANRSLKCNSNSIYQNERTTTDLNNILINEKAIDILICKMIKKEQQELKQAHQLRKVREENTVIQEFFNIFSELGLERKIKINIETETASLYDNDIVEYFLSAASDGEKTIAYIIMAILLMPENAYVFIDEPENHLNGVLMIDLFNKLEEARKDLKFIYLTHNIDFIESRNNVELIYLEKTKKINTWKFKKIENFEEIDLDIVLSIEGAKKDIIFCEGNNNSSIDYKIYSSIYKDYLVMPVSSCEKVIENVKVINNNSQIRRNAYGILDNDFKSEEEINCLKEQKIFTLKENEIEDLLLDEEIIEKVNELYINKDNIDEVKKYVIDFAKTNKTLILNEYLNKKYNKIIKSNKLTFSENLEMQIDSTNENNKLMIMDELKNFEKDMNSYIDNEEYNKLLTILPGKSIIKNVVKKLGFSDEKAYVAFIINKIRTNKDFKELLIKNLPKME